MRRLVISSLALMLTSGSAVQAADNAAVVDALNAVSGLGVKWELSKARNADVTCDGRTDTILFGTGKKSVWIGIVPGNGGKTQSTEFPINHNTQDGFCELPKKISVDPLNCSGSEGGKLPGCKQIKACKEFSVDDGDCDPFNFYWDARHKLIRWWRN